MPRRCAIAAVRRAAGPGPCPALDEVDCDRRFAGAVAEATGGAGNTFEARVGGIALERLLRGDRVPGLNLAPSRVRLQQRVAGAVLDDIVLDADDPLGGIGR